jgi:hypothetical protein
VALPDYKSVDETPENRKLRHEEQASKRHLAEQRANEKRQVRPQLRVAPGGDDQNGEQQARESKPGIPGNYNYNYNYNENDMSLSCLANDDVTSTRGDDNDTATKNKTAAEEKSMALSARVLELAELEDFGAWRGRSYCGLALQTGKKGVPQTDVDSAPG